MGILLILILITLVFIFWQLIQANRTLRTIADRRQPLD